MTLIRHECRCGRIALAVWTASIAALIALCIFLFPEMRGEMDAVGELFASMGGFTAAFGMDRLNIGTLVGFYAVECGNILGLGGAFFASLTGISVLAKEEKDKTAEFLLTHPISRAGVVTAKLTAVLLQIAAMNLGIFVLSLVSVKMIGEAIPWREILLLHGACFLLQVELACVCCGISAFLRRGGAGIGMGLAAVMYLLNLIANLTERAEFLKYLTPFGYCDGAELLEAGALNAKAAAFGILLACAGVAAAYGRYLSKDIQ